MEKRFTIEGIKNKKVKKVTEEVKKAIVGKDDCIFRVMRAILAGGHVLIEDIPGVGKTTMAVAFARAMSLKQNRVQFTPDVLPSDIVGFSMYRKEQEEFCYQPGAVMCNMLLADEINRTSPKTQSALLEVMEEKTVTVDGVTRRVPSPFFVIATENPVGYAGTQMLPESQLDRFMAGIKMGYPSLEDETAILMGHGKNCSLEMVNPVITDQELLELQRETAEVYIHPSVCRYLVELSNATRNHQGISLGLSTRGTLAVSSLAKAAAYMDGRDYVLPADGAAVFEDAAVHRLRLSAKAETEGGDPDALVRGILESVPMPRPEKTV